MVYLVKPNFRISELWFNGAHRISLWLVPTKGNFDIPIFLALNKSLLAMQNHFGGHEVGRDSKMEMSGVICLLQLESRM